MRHLHLLTDGGVHRRLFAFPVLSLSPSNRAIRETMVTILLATNSVHRFTDAGHVSPASASEGLGGVPVRGCIRGDKEGAMVDRVANQDPAACVFWCVVAIGGLVQGRPRESVSTG